MILCSALPDQGHEIAQQEMCSDAQKQFIFLSMLNPDSVQPAAFYIKPAIFLVPPHQNQ